MSNSFQDKVVLITGAGSGLGRQFAIQLAREGAKIGGIDVQQSGLVSLESELGPRFAYEVADVTDAAGLARAVQSLESKLGSTYLLIANAGVGFETSALTFDAAMMAKVIEVNLIGVSNSIAAVLPGMVERSSGHIVAISSLASYRGVPKMLGYCASKSGVNAIMEGLRVEVARHNIYTTLVCPGWIRTPLTEKVDAPMPKLMEVEPAARRIIDAIRRRKRFFAFPTSIAWRLSLLRWLPASVSDWLITQMMRSLKKK
jgi:short-subunit dehydrogenase